LKLELEAAVTHIVPGVIGCFACSGTDHWESACPEKIPVTTQKAHEARIDKYVQWFRDDDPPRITAHQKRQLIEAENARWAKTLKEKAK
jgi:hypothetical protein